MKSLIGLSAALCFPLGLEIIDSTPNRRSTISKAERKKRTAKKKKASKQRKKNK